MKCEVEVNPESLTKKLSGFTSTDGFDNETADKGKNRGFKRTREKYYRLYY